MKVQPLATGRVESLCMDGSPVDSILFLLDGPYREQHYGFTRKLSGHDGGYIRTSSLTKGSTVFNWRTWTGLSTEEIKEVESKIGVGIPQGCLLENITLSGIPDFSRLAPTTRLVFPVKDCGNGKQAILAVWEENSPCKGVGEPLERYHGIAGLKTRFIAEARHKRGVMGLVLAVGRVEVGDTVLVYPPLQ
ncbi:MAG: hypothetical protein AAB919_02525 [Patescibacteria group bacterium]